MPDFKGTDFISLQPRSVENAYRFDFDPPSSATGRGGIPYGLTISSASVSAAKEDGTDVTSSMIQSSTVSGDSTVDVRFDWVEAGKFYITFVLTLSDSSVWEFNFNRVEGKDL